MSGHFTFATTSDKFTLYSGHDNSILPLLTALGYRVPQWPPYASRVAMELYAPNRGPRSAQNLIVKVVYNGKDITQSTGFCGKKSICSLKDLLGYFTKPLKFFGYGLTWHQACQQLDFVFFR